MTVRAKFFATFRDLFGARERDLELAGGASVGEALELLCDTPERRREVLAAGGLKPHVVVMVNGTPIGSLQGLATPLAPGDTLAVFPMMGGG
ncbi:MAG TPA: ubiquitin-like small modifier protein 1 [Acidobacteriota bacterium]|nr:ubiquitin-like small modifier protein 1 [Acidobacteriota bacterium]